MSNNDHKSIMDQVWAYTRILTITGGVAMSTFILAGYVWMVTPVPAVNSLVEANETIIVSEKSDAEITPGEAGRKQLEKPAEAVLTESRSYREPEVNLNSKSSGGATLSGDEKPVASKAVQVFVESDMFENFRTECQDGIVNITWTTDGTDDESFKLEFSADSLNFHVLNDLPVRTEVKNNKNLFCLTLPASKAETKFFRLRREFPGNAFMYSEAVKVACMQSNVPEAMIDIYPSGNGTYRVVIDSKVDDHFSIVMTDMNEIELVTDAFDVSKGMNQITFKSGIMPRGNYNLKVSNGTNVIQKKVAIK